MGCIKQTITDDYALYNGDCIETLESFGDNCIDLSVYSPPFGGLYHYSSDDRDMSNHDSYDAFMDHYGFLIDQIKRVTKPGRVTAVHCMDVPQSNTGKGDALVDFPGDIIRAHQARGFKYRARHAIWKEPLAVRLRTMQKNLAHATLVEDSINVGVASADYLLVFQAPGENAAPVAHPRGLFDYAGERKIPNEILPFRGYDGKQTENRFSHWIWRQYASSFWDDIRIDRVLPYKESREEDDEKHVHPLQLDVVDRVVTLYSNPREAVLTPFMGVGTEVYSPIMLNRRGIGVELKESYYRQAVKNCEMAAKGIKADSDNLELAV